jgi:DNA-binding transcriptional regulator YiaG
MTETTDSRHIPVMTGNEYRSLRQPLGSQHQVARMLQVGIRTVQRREAGEVPIFREAALAIEQLHHTRKKK